LYDGNAANFKSPSDAGAIPLFGPIQGNSITGDIALDISEGNLYV
jgi:hypothetical protein